MVRMRGLEPPRLAASAPKTDVSTISPHPHSQNQFCFIILPFVLMKSQFSLLGVTYGQI